MVLNNEENEDGNLAIDQPLAKRVKKSYEDKRKFQMLWVVKHSWAEINSSRDGQWQ